MKKQPKVIFCEKNKDLERQVKAYAETLREQAHTIGDHGLSELDFYQGGVFRGAIERLRGQFSATMSTKKQFVATILEYMQQRDYIIEWSSAGGKNRFDYAVLMPDGKNVVIELKGALDGNNTTIFERPHHANEFLIWSVSSNAAGDPRKNVWSGIHTRLSAEIIDKKKQVDGLIVWDWLCGTISRRCPKIASNQCRVTTVDHYRLTPPCIYLLPSTVPSPRNNAEPEPHTLDNLGFLKALHQCFGGNDDEIYSVKFKAQYSGNELNRTTTVEKDGIIEAKSEPTPIRRS